MKVSDTWSIISYIYIKICKDKNLQNFIKSISIKDSILSMVLTSSNLNWIETFYMTHHILIYKLYDTIRQLLLFIVARSRVKQRNR